MEYAAGDSDDAAARGADAFIDCKKSVLAAIVPSLPFETVANVSDKCLRTFVLESIYVPLCTLHDDARADEFGPSSVSVAMFNQIESRLKEFQDEERVSFAPCSFAEYAQRLASLPDDDAFILSQSKLDDNEQHPAGTGVNLYWVDEIPLSTLCDHNGRLGPFGSLAALIGPRNLAVSRRLEDTAASQRFAMIWKQLQPVARSFDALPLAPANGAHFLAQPDDQRDVEAALCEWLCARALPLELSSPLVAARDARTEINLRTRYADGHRLEVIQRRFDSFVKVFPSLARVVRGSAVPQMLEYSRMLASRLAGAVKELDSVAAFHALERSLAKVVYVLDVGAGDADLSVNERVLKLISAAEEASARASSGGAGGVAHAQGADSSLSQKSTVAAGGAKALHSTHATQLNIFLALHEADALKALHSPERGMSDSPIGSKDPSRVLRAAFRLRLVPIWQFLLRSGANNTSSVFMTLDPYRTELAAYLSEAVILGDDGTVPPRCGGFELDETFLKHFVALDWEKLDFFNGLRSRILNHKEPRVKHNVSWPHGVFGSADYVRHIKEVGDKLFAAIGYPVRSRFGFWGKVSRLQAFLDDNCPVGAMPEPKLIKCFNGIIKSAAAKARQAMSAGPDFDFPSFGSIHDPWVKELDDLVAAAEAKRGQDELCPPARLNRGVSFESTLAAARPGRSPSPARSEEGLPARTALKSAMVDKETPGGAFKASPGGSTGFVRPATGGVGDNAANVYMDASVLRVTFARRYPADASGSSTFQWNVKDVSKYLKEHEGTDAKCFPCAVVRLADRHTFCNCAGAPGHESPTSRCHSFKSQPWRALSEPRFCKRV